MAEKDTIVKTHRSTAPFQGAKMRVNHPLGLKPEATKLCPIRGKAAVFAPAGRGWVAPGFNQG